MGRTNQGVTGNNKKKRLADDNITQSASLVVAARVWNGCRLRDRTLKKFSPSDVNKGLRKLVPVADCNAWHFQTKDEVGHVPGPQEIRSPQPHSRLKVYHKEQHMETGHANKRNRPLITDILANSIDH